MKLNAGIITTKFAETRDFYVNQLGFGVTFENEWYLLLHTPGGQSELAFLMPDLPAQDPLFRKPFAGGGVYLTIETDNVDQMYERILATGIPIVVPIRDEEWGDRHFAIQDPNGIGIDFVHYSAPGN